MLTPLAVAALAMLVESPMHPYEMYQLMLQRREDRLVKLRPGSLYHTIDRLQRDGLAQIDGTDREGNRPERTIYSITDGGRSALSARVAGMLAQPADEYPEFPLGLSEANNLPRDRAVALLETRLAVLKGHEAELDSSRERLIAKAVPEKYWIDLEYQRAMLQAQIVWIRQFVRQMTTDELTW